MTDFDARQEDILERYLDSRQEELHTALPGKVEGYDAASQTASVTPMVGRKVPTRDGGLAREALPTVRSVPVLWPRAGAWFVHMPLAAGDFVLLVCCERDLAGWRQSGERSDPIDLRAHHLAHAVAIPGVYPRRQELGDTPGDALVIGQDGGATVRIQSNEDILIGTNATDLVALATRVENELDKIRATLESLTGGSSAPAEFTVPYTPGPVGASKTRAE